MIKLYKHNIFWGNNTFIKPDIDSWRDLTSKDFTTLEANIIWTSYNRGHIQLKTEKGLYTYLEDAGRYYFLYPNQTLSKTKSVVVYEVVPDVWVNKILNKPFDGVLITTSKEEEILDNDNLVKPINTYWKPAITDTHKKINLDFNWGFIYALETKWITEFNGFNYTGSQIKATLGSADNIPTDKLTKFKNLSNNVYKMNRWIDGSPLPSEFKDFYVIGKKVNGVSENIPKTISDTENLSYFTFQKFGVNKTSQYVTMPILGNGLNFSLGTNFIKYSDVYLTQRETTDKVEVIPSPENDNNDLNYLIFGGKKQLTNKTTLSKTVITGYTNSLQLGDIPQYNTVYENFSTYLIDKPIQTDFTYGDTIRKDNSNWQINLWPFYTDLEDNDFLLDTTKKVIITKNNIYLHKSLLKFSQSEIKNNVFTISNDNNIKHTLLFRDGETVELPYGESKITYNNKIYENGIVLTLTVENERLSKKWIKTTKETTNFLDNNLKYLQLQQLNRNYNLSVYKNEVENKKAKSNLISNIVGGLFGIAGSGGSFTSALGQSNYSGITSSIGVGVSAITNISNSIINYKYDNEIRKREFENSVFEYNINKQTLERQLIKLDTSINFVSEWQSLLEEEQLGDDGFVIVIQKPSEYTKELYKLYLNNIGFPTNTYILKEHTLSSVGIYQFGFFIETDPEDGEDIKSILTNPIKIISTIK